MTSENKPPKQSIEDTLKLIGAQLAKATDPQSMLLCINHLARFIKDYYQDNDLSMKAVHFVTLINYALLLQKMSDGEMGVRVATNQEEAKEMLSQFGDCAFGNGKPTLH